MDDGLSLVSWIPDVERIMQAAAAAVMDLYGTAEVAWKPDDSPITEADRASDRILTAGLAAWGLPVVSEENHVDTVGRCWLIDPLDGTKEFIHRRGEFTVNVALVEDGTPRFGVVVAPVQGVSFAGIPGVGAWRRTARETWQRIQCNEVVRDHPVRIVTSRSHASGPLEAFEASIQGAGLATQRHPGGSSLKLCRVAEGTAEVYPRFGPTMPWDIAAGQAVVEGAGGTVQTVAGDRLTYPDLRAKNPWFIAGCRTRWPWTRFVPPS